MGYIFYDEKISLFFTKNETFLLFSLNFKQIFYLLQHNYFASVQFSTNF